MLEKNKQYTVKISSLGYEGEGVAKVDSYPIFIPGALPSETVNVEIIKNKKNYANGELVNILEESEDRVNPKCKYYNKCGGCVLMHINYESQKDFKYNRVKDCIKRIGNISRDVVKKTIGMENEYRYRNKGILSVGYVNNKLSIGFLSEKTHEIVDIDDCLIQNEETMEIINIIKKWMNKYSIKAARNEGVFDNSGLIRNIMIRKTFKTNEIMVVLITTNKKIPYREELINELKEGFENIKGIVQNINSQNNNLILGHECITLWGQDYISDYIGEYKFNISPLSFFQVNPVQTEVLYSKALEYANLTGNEVVFDAYCGTGTITLFLSKKAKKVYGVEIVEQAIKNAIINAKNNKIINTEFHVGKSEEVIPRLIKQGIKPDVIVVDPPRKGCDVKLLDAIGNAKPKKIVYVSCDPSTLARDLKYLETLGYDTVEVQPVDMFPNTKHVETVTLLIKR